MSSICQAALMRACIEAEVALKTVNERIEVEVDGRVKAFTGRWLVAPVERFRTSEEGFDLGLEWAVAMTARGKLALLVGKHGEWDDLDVVDVDTQGMASGIVLPGDLLDLARERIDSATHVEELDI